MAFTKEATLTSECSKCGVLRAGKVKPGDPADLEKLGLRKCTVMTILSHKTLDHDIRKESKHGRFTGHLCEECQQGLKDLLTTIDDSLREYMAREKK